MGPIELIIPLPWLTSRPARPIHVPQPVPVPIPAKRRGG